MEARIARIESDVAHLRSDVADIKADVRARFDRADTRIDRLESKLDALTQTVFRAQIWALLLYITFATGTLGAMARGFGWL